MADAAGLGTGELADGISVGVEVVDFAAVAEKAGLSTKRGSTAVSFRAFECAMDAKFGLPVA